MLARPPMRLIVALLVLAGCTGSSVVDRRPASPETVTVQGLRVLVEPGNYTPGDSLTFVLDFQSVRGPDGEYRASPGYGRCDRRLDRWNGVTWAPVSDELWRPGEMVRQYYGPGTVGIGCTDVAVQWGAGVSASQRLPYRLSGDAEPGWYRWCQPVSMTGDERTRSLCSEVVSVGRSARRAG